MTTITTDDLRTYTCTAVALGWQVAGLYIEAMKDDHAPAAGAVAAGLPPSLDGSNGSSVYSMGVKQIRSGLAKLRPLLEQVDEADFAAKGDADLQDLDHLIPEEARKRILAFHLDAQQTLQAADFRVGKGYALGRDLANLAASAPSKQGLSPIPTLAKRLTKIRDRIDDLRSVLPDHAGKPVQDNIAAWQAWLAHPVDDNRKPVDLQQAEVINDVNYAADRQGRRWRSLLTQEKDPVDLLSARGYLSAAQALILSYRQMVTSFIRHWWPYLVLVLLAVGGLVAVFVEFTKGTSSALGVAATALGAVGITGKTVSTTLQKAATDVQKQLSGAEIDTAVSGACQRLPYKVTMATSKRRSNRGQWLVVKRAA